MRRSIRSERVKLPRVHRVTRGGKVFRYHRRTRAQLPADVPEDHPSFLAAWMAEEAKTPLKPTKAAPGTIAAGCESYLASRSFSDLSDSYRPVIRRHVDAIKAQGGRGVLKDLEPRHVESDLEPLSPAVAKSRMKAWRKLGEFWKVKGMTQIDPSKAAQGKRMPKTDGHQEWTRADLDRFRDRWPIGTPQRMVGELFQWTGARCVDIVALGPQMVRDGQLFYRQHKTRTECYVPWGRPPLEALAYDHMNLMAALGSPEGLAFHLTAHGSPRSEKSMSNWFSAASRSSGLVGLTAHGLRKYRMNALAEAGASVLQMQAWVGHTTLSEVERYTKKAQRRDAFRNVSQLDERRHGEDRS